MHKQRTGGRSTSTATLLLLLSSSLVVTSISPPHAPAAGRQDSRDELLSRWPAAGRQDLRDKLLSHRSAAGRQDSRDRLLSRLIDTYARGTTTPAVETPYRDAIETPDRDTLPSVVTVARNGRLDGTPCPTVEGLWLSTNLETAFDMRPTGMAGRLDVRAIGSDWMGGAESVFGDRGPLIAIVSQRDTGTAVTFVGHCRASNGVDTMTGVWVIASPAKNKLDHHLAVQPIPDTLHRLKVEYERNS